MEGIPEKIGRYQVESIAGRGAMGVVYKAVDPLIHRTVAIKMVSLPVILSDKQKKEFNERFFREAQAAGNLHHPNIVTIFDVGEHEGTPFMAQEFIEGESLSLILKRNNAMSIDEASDILRQMADALHYAHSQGVVHRDVKPDNILIDKNGRAVLTDFGVARLSSSNLTRTGEVLGTPNFMSPEQVLGEPVDGRSDLFSLGVILYLMLTGKKPYTGDSVTSICYQIVHSPPPKPEGMDLPTGIAYVLEKLMAKSKEDRFEDGAAVLQALDQMQDSTMAMGDAPPVMSESAADTPTTVMNAGASGSFPATSAATQQSGKESTEVLTGASPVANIEKGISTKSLIMIGAIGAVIIVTVGFLAFFIVAKLGKAVSSKNNPPGNPSNTVNQPVNDLSDLESEISLPDGTKMVPKTPERTSVTLGASAKTASGGKSKTSSTSSTKKAGGTSTSGSNSSSTGNATPAKPEDTKEKDDVVNARIGLIVEGGLAKGTFQVLTNGKEKVVIPFKGMPINRGMKRYAFRIVKEIALKPGRHTLTFVLSSPSPRAFSVQATRTFDIKSGDRYILKIEPRRFPARLKITVIEQKHAE